MVLAEAAGDADGISASDSGAVADLAAAPFAPRSPLEYFAGTLGAIHFWHLVLAALVAASVAGAGAEMVAGAAVGAVLRKK